jgi:hypothetical protein
VPNRSRNTFYTPTHLKEASLTKEYFILENDKQWLTARINELEQTIQDLGPDFYEVFNQSSETWHDNAPFDALRDKQSVLFAEYSKLKILRRHTALGVPRTKKGFVNYGSTVIIKGKKFYIAGDWTPHAGTVQDNVTIVSAQSPLAQGALGKQIGDITPFGKIEIIIDEK